MARNTDEQYHALMTGKPIFDYHLSDPKPAKQIKADGDDWKDLRFWKLDKKKCRICEDHPADTLHHLVPRSLRGDDVADNLVGLCGSGTTGCHGLVEDRNPWACSLLGLKLTAKERDYIIGKKGAPFLERYYGRDAA
jgi:hypothetical protein